MKEREGAALRLQAFTRATLQRRKVRAQQRALFDAELQSTLQVYAQALAPTAAAPPSSSPLPALLLCVRRFLLFYSPREAADGGRWQSLQQLLSLSLRAPQPQVLRPGASGLSSSLHYGSLLLLSPDLRSAWIHQVSRITGLLLRDIHHCDAAQQPSLSHSAIFLLFQLFTAQQWSVCPTARTAHGPPFALLLPSSSLATLQSSITSAQLSVLSRWVFAQPPPSLPRPSSSSPSSAAPRPLRSLASPSVSWHSALRSRLLHLAVLEEDTKPGMDPSSSTASVSAASASSASSSSSMSTADKNAIGLLALLLPLPLQLALSSSSAPPPQLPPSFATSYTLHVLSIPLLSARLSAVGLSAVVGKVVDPTLVMARAGLGGSPESAQQRQRLIHRSFLTFLCVDRPVHSVDR